MQSLNELRRKGLEALEKECLQPFRRVLDVRRMDGGEKKTSPKPEKSRGSKKFLRICGEMGTNGGS